MMRPIPITIAAVFLFAIGVASIAGLVVPQTRMYLHPHWAVALASTNLLATATGFWFMRRWAPFVFFAIWGIQYALTIANGAPLRFGSGLVGALIVGCITVFYWKKLK